MSAMRGATAVVGISEFHYPRGKAPVGERAMVLRAIIEACADAGISPREIDGFTSYAGGDNSGPVLASELGIDELRWSSMVWGGGGGGAAASINAAAAAIVSGQAEVVVAFRGMSQADTGRLGYAKYYFDNHYLPHGAATPAHVCALRTQRMLEHDGVPASALRGLVLAAYAHAQNTPDAAAYGKPLDETGYAGGKAIVEPFRLYDCSRENDGAAALVLVSAERAKQLGVSAAYVLGGTQGAPGGYSARNDSDDAVTYTSAGFGPGPRAEGVAARLWKQSGLTPETIDVVQVYENFSGPAVASLIDHGLCPPGPAAGDFMTVQNLTVGGRLPVNTAGGNIAGSFINGMGMGIEAVRQIRGTSTNQVADADTSLFIGGPMAPMVGSVVLGTDRTL